jgi:hypothetical protein
VKGPFVHSESATSDVVEDEELDVFVDEIDEELLLEEVVLTLLIDVALVDDEVVVFFVEDDVVVFFVEEEDVVVFLTARAAISSMARASFSPITAAEAARLKDRRVQRPNFRINILLRTKEEK